MRNAAWNGLWAPILLSACPHRAPEPPLAVCPSIELEVDLDACGELPEAFGKTREQPLEWGDAAVGSDELYYGRLACSDGAFPRAQRVGPVGDADVVDQWTVTCPGREPVTLFTSIHRCGNACPPRSLSLVPATAMIALEHARHALDAGDLDQALAQAEHATTIAPGAELPWMALAIVHIERADFASAEQAIARAEAFSPRSPMYRLWRAQLARELGDVDEYRAKLRALATEVAADDPMRGDVACLEAFALRDEGKRSEAQVLADEACALGVSPCCPPDWDGR